VKHVIVIIDLTCHGIHRETVAVVQFNADIIHSDTPRITRTGQWTAFGNHNWCQPVGGGARRGCQEWHVAAAHKEGSSRNKDHSELIERSHVIIFLFPTLNDFFSLFCHGEM
jgi:hypothetical protein